MAAAATRPAAVPAAGAAEAECSFFGDAVGVGVGLALELSTVDGRPVVVAAVAVADLCRLGGFVVGAAETPACDESGAGASEVLDAWPTCAGALVLAGRVLAGFVVGAGDVVS